MNELQIDKDINIALITNNMKPFLYLSQECRQDTRPVGARVSVSRHPKHSLRG
jgi:hypothetical protein